MLCPFCHGPVPDGETVCPSCGKPQLESGTDERDGVGIGYVCLTVLLMALVVVGLWLVARQDDRIPGDFSLLFSVWDGAHAVLVTKGGGPAGDEQPVLVAATQRDYAEAQKALEIGDQFGYEEMLAKGQIRLVPQGTPILVLDRDILMVKVRILAGGHVGEAGWVPLSCVRPQPK